MKTKFLLFLFLLFPLVLPASTQSDEKIALDVGKAIQQNVFYDIFDWVEGSVHGGVVTLSGYVHQPFHKDEIVKRVEKAPGVKAVRDEIQVLPVSTYDDRLRIRVARRIYSQPALQRYAIGAHPPIHIIVNKGVITLEGYVDSAFDKNLIGFAARESSAFRVTNDVSVER